MSGYSDVSRQAFKRVNVTAGQEKIVAFLRARPNLKPTRGEISDLTRIPINVVTARVFELINDFDPPMLRELPIRDGARPLELIENAPRSTHCDGSMADEFPQTGGLPASSMVIASHAARPIGVRPYIPGRWSMSIEAAKQIVKDPANAFIEEARKVIQTGAHWVTG